MHDSPFVGRHGFEADGVSGVHDPLRNAAGHVGQSLVSSLLVAFDIHLKVRVDAQLLADHVLDQELERFQGFAPAADEQPGIVALDIERRAAEVFFVGLGQRRNHIDSEQRDDLVENLCGRCHDIGRSVEQRYSHLGGFAADAQNAGFAPANDVYFDLCALCVEFL